MIPTITGLALIALGLWRARRMPSHEVRGYDLVRMLKRMEARHG
jgi:hypothetical protein